MTGLAVCEIARVTGRDVACGRVADQSARLMHVAGANTGSVVVAACSAREFALCVGHVNAVRGEVAHQLASLGPQSRCAMCGSRIRAISDVVGSVIAL